MLKGRQTPPSRGAAAVDWFLGGFGPGGWHFQLGAASGGEGLRLGTSRTQHPDGVCTPATPREGHGKGHGLGLL